MSEEFFQLFHSDILKHSQLDSFHTYGDLFAPGVDQFESELDSDPSVATFEIPQAFAADPTPAFTVLRSEPFIGGPPSAFTADSDSAYNDTFSNHSSSLYSPSSAFGSTPSSNLPFDLDFSKINMETLSEYSEDINGLSAAFGFDNYSPSPDHSPTMPTYTSRDARSDYEPQSLSVVAPMLTSLSDYTPSTGIKVERPIARRQATLTPSSTVSPPATSPEPYHADELNLTSDDPKKKYKCPNCPRAFARAFNLKTHRETHNPNRAKPHMCPHSSCGRSFSRKHDLGRHITAIHRDAPTEDLHVGVERGSRTRCQSCGKSWVGGKVKSCNCNYEVR
ncbi:hypothetical protein BJ322DRAFT_1052377 [Thelephora terrestris]|uniref:C2H2-type domain-containing protein n=1 Tax=Thelephora terrestris TaxID=56493 RepID=A0A9P6L874_9AGAM|nr:hypothetical protein BJ322DRAFT_1052377 [Thelephora terrestris]